jgi:hypothetical protein
VGAGAVVGAGAEVAAGAAGLGASVGLGAGVAAGAHAANTIAADTAITKGRILFFIYSPFLFFNNHIKNNTSCL